MHTLLNSIRLFVEWGQRYAPDADIVILMDRMAVRFRSDGVTVGAQVLPCGVDAHLRIVGNGSETATAAPPPTKTEAPV
jgi:hypothetical protein